MGSGVRFGIPHRFVTDESGRRWACFQRDTISVNAGQARQNFALALRVSVGVPPPPSQAMVDAISAVHARRREERQRFWQNESCGDPTCPSCHLRLEELP